MATIPTTAGVNKIPLHEEAITYLRIRAETGAKQYHQCTPEEAREVQEELHAVFSTPKDFNGTIKDLYVPSDNVPGGIPIRVYKPSTSRGDPAIWVYFHGGGQVLGSVALSDECCKTLAETCEVIIVSVEYRLAPEHKLPAGLEDCDNATRWVLQNKTKVGGTANSIVGVGGTSAGGQSSALTCHYVDGLGFEILIYGRLDERTNFPAYTEFKDGPSMTDKLVKWYKKYRLPDLSPSLTNPRFSSLQQPRFDHIPPTLFIVAQCDPIRDDSYEYSKKLTEAGVHNELHLVKGALHGFFNFPSVYKECCREAYAEVRSFIKRIVYKDKED